MIAVTERAAFALEEVLLSSDPPPGEGLKLTVSGNQIALMMAPPAQGDQVFQHDGEPLLIIDGDIAQAVDGTQLTIDCEIEVKDGHARREFHFVAPSSDQ
ncbi:MAG TPA: hypothetical protein VK009_22625 [Chloroflexota bacterium]|nr:hypothetical protein [Chloroflexota bacterium]